MKRWRLEDEEGARLDPPGTQRQEKTMRQMIIVVSAPAAVRSCNVANVRATVAL